MTNTDHTTELVFILDRSGSMAGLESDTIGGFNGLVEKQRRQAGTCYVSTVLFDHESVVLHDREKLTDVKLMTEQDYTVRGCTALLDAVGDAIRRYTAEEIKKLIQQQKEKYGWEFLFIGANIDAVETAALYGIDRERAVKYCADSQGTQHLYQTMERAVHQVRCNAPLSADWAADLQEDCRRRGR